MSSRHRVLILALGPLLAGCGGSSEPESPEPARQEEPPTREDSSPAPEGESPGPVPPDGGVPEGHGAPRGDGDGVRIPDLDSTPPAARLALRLANGRIVVSNSPVRDGPAGAISLDEPRLRATGVAIDADGGTGRVRVSARWRERCRAGEPARIVTHYAPPPQIEAIRIPPGRVVARQRRRSATFPIRECAAWGAVWAEATNAHGLEAFTDPLRFVYRPRAAPRP